MKKILICGGGALGSHALFLGRDLRHELAVIDYDRVETKNLASQWFVKQSVGKPKAAALKMQLLNFYGVKLHKDFAVELTELNADTILSDCDVIVDCFDNAASRQILRACTRVWPRMVPSARSAGTRTSSSTRKMLRGRPPARAGGSCPSSTRSAPR